MRNEAITAIPENDWIYAYDENSAVTELDWHEIKGVPFRELQDIDMSSTSVAGQICDGVSIADLLDYGRSSDSGGDYPQLIGKLLHLSAPDDIDVLGFVEGLQLGHHYYPTVPSIAEIKFGLPVDSELEPFTFAFLNAGKQKAERFSSNTGINQVESIQSPQEQKPNTNQEQLSIQLLRLFNEARYEVFEDGIDSDFSRGLWKAVQSDGVDAVSEIDALVSRGLNIEVEGEALRQLGMIEHAPTRKNRLGVLLRYLHSPKVQIRDSVSLGLASLDDVEAAPALRDAVNKEPSQLLRKNLQMVLSQLEDVE